METKLDIQRPEIDDALREMGIDPEAIYKGASIGEYVEMMLDHVSDYKLPLYGVLWSVGDVKERILANREKKRLEASVGKWRVFGMFSKTTP